MRSRTPRCSSHSSQPHPYINLAYIIGPSVSGRHLHMLALAREDAAVVAPPCCVLHPNDALCNLHSNSHRRGDMKQSSRRLSHISAKIVSYGELAFTRQGCLALERCSLSPGSSPRPVVAQTKAGMVLCVAPKLSPSRRYEIFSAPSGPAVDLALALSR